MSGGELRSSPALSVRDRAAGHSSLWALAVLLGAAALIVLWAGRGLVFRGDEWQWMFSGLHVSADSILQDYNGHLNATTEGFFYLMPSVFGLGHYWVLRVAALVVHLAVVTVFFLLARQRLGPGPALAASALVAVLGTGADVFVSAFGIGLVTAMAACLTALLMLSSQTRTGDLGACVMLMVGLASFSVAVAFTAGVFVEVMWLRNGWKRLWAPLLPALVYVGWRAGWGSGSLFADSSSPGGGPGSIVDLLHHALQAATGAGAGLLGVQLSSATLKSHLPWLASLAAVGELLALALLAWRIARLRHLSPRLANLLVCGASLWVLLAIGRGSLGDLYASRYVYLGAIVVALIVIELLPEDLSFARPVSGLLLAGVLFSAALNVAWLIVWGDFLRGESQITRGRLAALEIAGSGTPPQFQPSREFPLVPVTAGRYFAARRKFGGDPAETPAQLGRASAPARAAADDVLIRADALRLRPGVPRPNGPFPHNGPALGGEVTRSGSCITLTPTGARVALSLTPSSPGISITSGALGQVALRRFGDRYTPLAPPPGRPVTIVLALPLGNAAQPWHLLLVSTAVSRICSVAA